MVAARTNNILYRNEVCQIMSELQGGHILRSEFQGMRFLFCPVPWLSVVPWPHKNRGILTSASVPLDREALVFLFDSCNGMSELSSIVPGSGTLACMKLYR